MQKIRQLDSKARTQPLAPLLERDGNPIELLELKAEGRSSRVWKATCGNEVVAIKILPMKVR